MSLVTAVSALHAEETTLTMVDHTCGPRIGGIGARPIQTNAAVILFSLIRLREQMASNYAARVDQSVPTAHPAEVSGPTPEAAYLRMDQIISSKREAKCAHRNYLTILLTNPRCTCAACKTHHSNRSRCHSEN